MEIKIQGEYHKIGKSFKYVDTYDKLYHAIINGVYPRGTKLPGELTLSKELDVSRVTLRQSLQLLEEDGYVNIVQGVGTFVNDIFGFEKTKLDPKLNPIFTSTNMFPSQIETRFNIEASSEYIKNMLNTTEEMNIISDRWYRNIDDKIIAYSLSFTPLPLIEEYNVNINSVEAFTNFLEVDIYNLSTNVKYDLKTTKTGNFVSNRYQLSEDNKFIIIFETILRNEKVLTFSKHYIPLEYFNLAL